jgi:hypothetical protein
MADGSLTYRFTAKTWNGIMHVLFGIDNDSVNEECDDTVDWFLDTCLAVTREQGQPSGDPPEETLCMPFFSLRVLSVMCTDMAVLVGGQGGSSPSLKILMELGASATVDELIIQRPVFTWKRSLFRRAIREYLRETGQRTRWPSLVLGQGTSKRWLTRNLEKVTGEASIPHHTAELLVNTLFPMRQPGC